MNGRVFGHRKLFVFRTAATVHPPYWQNGGVSSLDLTATDRFLVPANAKAGSAARSPQTSRFLAEGIIGHARLLLPQPSLAVCVRRRCPNRGVATGRHLPMRHRTNHHNWTIETDASMYCCYIVKVFALQRFSGFPHFVISMETGWKRTNLSMGILYPFSIIYEIERRILLYEIRFVSQFGMSSGLLFRSIGYRHRFSQCWFWNLTSKIPHSD